jgi:hypothetical protein
VDLPQPDGPMRATISPAASSRSTPASTGRRPVGVVKVRLTPRSVTGCGDRAPAVVGLAKEVRVIWFPGIVVWLPPSPGSVGRAGEGVVTQAGGKERELADRMYPAARRRGPPERSCGVLQQGASGYIEQRMSARSLRQGAEALIGGA